MAPLAAAALLTPSPLSQRHRAGTMGALLRAPGTFPAGAAPPARCQPGRRARALAGPVLAFYDLNFNPLDYLKVPRHQVHITLYPWMEAHTRRERMRCWLQTELCMTDNQARSVLSRCPALADLDVRLAQRRLRYLDKEMNISRGDAALLVLRHPQQLLPHVSEVVQFASHQRLASQRPKGPFDDLP